MVASVPETTSKLPGVAVHTALATVLNDRERIETRSVRDWLLFLGAGLVTTPSLAPSLVVR